MKPRLALLPLTFLSFLTSVIIFAASLAAQDFGKTFAAIVTRAKREGKVRFCSGTPNEIEAKEFFKHFRERYREITLEYTRCRRAASSERILSELMAGQVDYDLIAVFDPLIPHYRKAGVLAGPL